MCSTLYHKIGKKSTLTPPTPPTPPTDIKKDSQTHYHLSNFLTT